MTDKNYVKLSAIPELYGTLIIQFPHLREEGSVASPLRKFIPSFILTSFVLSASLAIRRRRYQDWKRGRTWGAFPSPTRFFSHAYSLSVLSHPTAKSRFMVTPIRGTKSYKLRFFRQNKCKVFGMIYPMWIIPPHPFTYSITFGWRPHPPSPQQTMCVCVLYYFRGY